MLLTWAGGSSAAPAPPLPTSLNVRLRRQLAHGPLAGIADVLVGLGPRAVVPALAVHTLVRVATEEVALGLTASRERRRESCVSGSPETTGGRVREWLETASHEHADDS